jgi:hypothetical protein
MLFPHFFFHPLVPTVLLPRQEGHRFFIIPLLTYYGMNYLSFAYLSHPTFSVQF